MIEEKSVLKPSLLKEALSKEGRVWLPVEGASMSPLFPSAEEIRIIPFSANKVHRGDLVVFSQNGNLIFHRVVGVKNNAGEPRPITKGDNNIFWDSPQTIEAYVGKVSAVRSQEDIVELEEHSSRLSTRIIVFFSWLTGWFWHQAQVHFWARWLGASLAARILRLKTLFLLWLFRK